MSFDGAIAQTSSWRANVAISAALEVWPHLQEYSVMKNTSSRDWLVNKICALCAFACVGDDPLMMSGCDAVLLARLFIEEQQLDEGRSNSVGKYGSKFHPSSDTSMSYTDNDGRGTRPLTVGEVQANWSEQGLRDTLRVKYHVNYKDPMPIIQKKIKALSEIPFTRKDDTLPQINSLLVEAIVESDFEVFVLVGHTTHMEMVKELLSHYIGEKMITCIDKDGNYDVASSGRVLLVAPKEDQSHHDVIRQIVSEVPSGSFIHAIHGSWSTLQQAKVLLGDDSPRLREGFGKVSGTTSTSSNTHKSKSSLLKLSLPAWADTVDPRQLNDALMDPWTGIIEETAFLESLSAKISLKK